MSLRDFDQPTYARDIDHVRSEPGFILRPPVEQFQESHSHEVYGERVDGKQRRPFFERFVVEEIPGDFFCLFGSCWRRFVELRGGRAALTSAVTKQSRINDQDQQKRHRTSLIHEDMQLSFVVLEFLHGLLDIVLVGGIHLQPKITQRTTVETRDLHCDQ